MSFLQTVLAVLTGQDEISELPSDKLIALTNGEPIERRLSQEDLHKIIRLQTLIVHEQERGAMFEQGGLPEEDGQDTQNVMAQYLAVQEDATARVIMLERLIVELVREAVPAECERFDVRYSVNLSLEVLRSRVSHHRFLD